MLTKRCQNLVFITRRLIKTSYCRHDHHIHEHVSVYSLFASNEVNTAVWLKMLTLCRLIVTGVSKGDTAFSFKVERSVRNKDGGTRIHWAVLKHFFQYTHRKLSEDFKTLCICWNTNTYMKLYRKRAASKNLVIMQLFRNISSCYGLRSTIFLFSRTCRTSNPILKNTYIFTSHRENFPCQCKL
jgi:hypothetical protein